MKQITIIGIFIMCCSNLLVAQTSGELWKKQLEKQEQLADKGLLEKALRQTKALEKKQVSTGFSKPTLPATQVFRAYLLESYGKAIEAQELAFKAEEDWKLSSSMVDSSIRYYSELLFAKTWLKIGYTQLAQAHIHQARQTIPPHISRAEQLSLLDIQQLIYRQSHHYSLAQKMADSITNEQRGYIRKAIKVYDDSTKQTIAKKVKGSVYKANKKAYAQWKLYSAENRRYVGDFPYADSIYPLLGDTLSKYVKKKDDVMLTWMQGQAALYEESFRFLRAARWYKRAKSKHANRVINRVPDAFYLNAFEHEIIANLKADEHKKAEKAVNRFDREVVHRFGKKSTHHLQARRLKNEDDIYNAEYVKALRRVNRNINVLQDYYPATHPGRIDLIKQYQLLQIKNNNYPLAAQLQKRILNIVDSLHGTETPIYQEELLELAKIEALYTFDFNTADSLFKNYLKPGLVDAYHPFHPNYIPLLNAYAQLHMELDRYDSALHYFEAAKDIAGKKFGTETVYYGYQLGQMALVHVELGQFIKAEELLSEAIKTIKSDRAKETYAYYSALQQLGELQKINGKFEDAEKTLTKALRVAKRIGLEVEGSGASSTLAYAQVLTEAGRYKEAEDILRSNIDIQTKKHGSDYYKLIEPYAALASISLIKGDFILAEKQVREALRITQERLSDSSRKYLDNTILLGDVYYSMGNYDASEEAYQLAITNTVSSLGPDHIMNATILTKIVRLQIAQELPADSTLATVDEALSIVTKAVGNQHPAYAEALELKADILMSEAQYNEALELLSQAQAIYVNSYGEGHLTTARNTVRVANLNYYQKDYAKAALNYKAALKAFQRIFGKQHPDYTATLSKLGRTHYAAGELDEASEILEVTTSIYLEYIERYFPSLTENEKAKYWKKIRPDFEIYNSLAIRMAADNPGLVGEMYNNKLATKALLLSSSLKVKQQLLASGDEGLITLYTQWISKRESLTRSLSLSYEEQAAAGIQPNVLEREIAQLEKQLGERSASFAASKNQKLYSWKDVRKTLLEHEAAIEIIRFNYFSDRFTDSVIYAALVVTKETKQSPQLVLLGNGNDLETKYFKYYRNSIKFKAKDKYSYTKFWKSIDEALIGKSTIYLSSDGVYNQMNPETYLKPDGSYLLDDYLFYNVSNTKELVIHAEAEPEPYLLNSAALFGNPAFSVNTKEQETDDLAQVSRSVGNSISSVDPLPGAEKEVEQIDQLLYDKQWNTTTFLKKSATEGQLKMLNNPRVLHVATHGFFIEGDKVEVSSLASDEAPVENPLLKSGLLFTGSEELLATNNIYQFNKKDGILTAYEAMNLQLDNTELVVLSACETGLGEVKSGEGVYGLQRAFIVAGAQNVIMTLFKVNDEITQQLMQQFYQEWLETGNKRTAFLNAKRTVLREHESPILWGSFMMIGLD